MTVEAVQQSFLDLDEDLATRAAIVEALDDTLFVEAGAGSGKTKALVERVVALVTHRDVPMREIAAVTFDNLGCFAQGVLCANTLPAAPCSWITATVLVRIFCTCRALM